MQSMLLVLVLPSPFSADLTLRGKTFIFSRLVVAV
jgi:hypothetical protein